MVVASSKKEEASPSKEWTGFPRIGIANGIPMSPSGSVGTDSSGQPILSAGAFFLKDPEAYAKTIEFRPLKYMFSYVKYDRDFKQVQANSLYMPMGTFYYDDGIYDSAGGQRCGRPDATQMAQLSKEEQNYIRSHTPLYVSLFGLAYFNEAPVLCELRVSKRKLFQLSKSVEAAIKSRYAGKITFKNAVEVYAQELSKHMFKLSLKQEIGPDGNKKTAPTGNPIWEIVVESTGYDMPSADIVEPMAKVTKFLAEANNKTMEAYNKAIGGAAVVDAVTAVDDEAPWDTEE